MQITGIFRNLWIWAVMGCLVVAVGILALQLPQQIRHGEKGQLAIQMLDAMRRPFLSIKQAEVRLIEGDAESAATEFAKATESASALLANYQQIALYNTELSKSVARLAEAYQEWLAIEQNLFNRFSQSVSDMGKPDTVDILKQLNNSLSGFLKTMDQLGEGEPHIHQDIDKGRRANRLLLILMGISFLYLVGLIFLQQYNRTHVLQNTHGELMVKARQQEAVADLGQLALSGMDISSLSDRIVKIVAETLNVEYCKILEFFPEKNEFLLRAGIGWKEGLVGNTTVDAGENSQAGYTLLSSEPVIVKDLRREKRFNGPPLLFEHGVVSGMSVIIHGQGRPFGVLGAHTTQQRIFSKDDVNFLQAATNILADAIERRRMEDALQMSEENFRALAENANDGILISYGHGSLVYANRRAAEIVGYSIEEMLRITIKDLAHPDKLPGMIEEFKKILEGVPNSSNYETIIAKKDGKSLPVEVTISRTIWRGATASLVIMRDITERKKLEAELIKTSKLESLGVLAGGIAHDYNNILTAIMANISLVKTYMHPEDQAYKRLTEAEKASLRARDLTLQLMTFAKGGVPIKKPISVDKLIKDSAALALSGSNVQYILDIKEETWPVEADEGQMSQVFHNLLINAVQAMPDGGIVRVGCENVMVEIREGRKNISMQKGRYVKVSIQDHGVGIPAEYQGKIFDPYFTTKEKGSGLGLATAYSIVKNHGGYISVESEAEAGSTFDVYLPASDKAVPIEAKADESPHVGTGRILIMDDEEVVRAAAGRMLEHIGYKVDFAADGEEAIDLYQKAKDSGQPFDAIIMDLTIPGKMGGAEAIKKLLEVDPKAKAIVSSGYHNDPIMANYRKYGFSALLPKPYRISELSKTLHNVLKEG